MLHQDQECQRARKLATCEYDYEDTRRQSVPPLAQVLHSSLPCPTESSPPLQASRKLRHLTYSQLWRSLPNQPDKTPVKILQYFWTFPLNTLIVNKLWQHLLGGTKSFYIMRKREGLALVNTQCRRGTAPFNEDSRLRIWIGLQSLMSFQPSAQYGPLQREHLTQSSNQGRDQLQ